MRRDEPGRRSGLTGRHRGTVGVARPGFTQNTVVFFISGAALSANLIYWLGFVGESSPRDYVGRVPDALPEVSLMADWRKLALSAILADGVIDEAEVKILKKSLWADGVIDREEVKFLIELRNTAQKKATGDLHPAFERLFFSAIEQNVLADGKITAREANWLRTMLFADGKIDANEKKFLMKLKKSATAVSPAFEKLYEECMAK